MGEVVRAQGWELEYGRINTQGRKLVKKATPKAQKKATKAQKKMTKKQKKMTKKQKKAAKTQKEATKKQVVTLTSL